MTSTADRDAWLAQRKGKITGTRIAAICGIKSYSTPWQVYLELNGLAKEEESEIFDRGNDMEPVTARRYERETKTTLIKEGFVEHPEVPYFGASPDYSVIGKPIGVECKSANGIGRRNFGEYGTDDVPQDYMCQVQWQMACKGWERVDIPLSGPWIDDFGIFPIHRHDEAIAIMMEHGHRFYQRYVAPGCVDFATAQSELMSGEEADTSWVKGYYPKDIGTEVLATPEIEEVCLLLKEARIAFDEAKRDKERLENLAKSFMGTASELKTTMGTFTWRKSVDGSKLDAKALAEELRAIVPDIDTRLARNTKPTVGARRFLTPFKKED